jgi:dihydroorotase
VAGFVDPASNLDRVLNVAIQEGRIAAVEEDLPASSAERSFDAAGKIISPDLIDLHFHGFHHVSPLSVPVDHYCLSRV